MCAATACSWAVAPCPKSWRSCEPIWNRPRYWPFWAVVREPRLAPGDGDRLLAVRPEDLADRRLAAERFASRRASRSRIGFREATAIVFVELLEATLGVGVRACAAVDRCSVEPRSVAMVLEEPDRPAVLAQRQRA